MINYNALQAEYPKAFRKFMEWVGLPVGQPILGFNDRNLYDFFDSQGIYITPKYSRCSHDKGFDYKITSEKKDRESCGFQYSRIEAERIAFTKAFEMLSEILK